MNVNDIIPGEYFKPEALIIKKSDKIENTILNSKVFEERFDWNIDNNKALSRVTSCSSDKDTLAQLSKTIDAGLTPILVLEKLDGNEQLLDTISDLKNNINYPVLTLENDAQDIAGLITNPLGKTYKLWLSAFVEPLCSAVFGIPKDNELAENFDRAFTQFLNELPDKEEFVIAVALSVDINCMKLIENNKDGVFLESTIWPSLKLVSKSGKFSWLGPIPHGTVPKIKIGEQLYDIKYPAALREALNIPTVISVTSALKNVKNKVIEVLQFDFSSLMALAGGGKISRSQGLFYVDLTFENNKVKEFVIRYIGDDPIEYSLKVIKINNGEDSKGIKVETLEKFYAFDSKIPLETKRLKFSKNNKRKKFTFVSPQEERSVLIELHSN